MSPIQGSEQIFRPRVPRPPLALRPGLSDFGPSGLDITATLNLDID